MRYILYFWYVFSSGCFRSGDTLIEPLIIAFPALLQLATNLYILLTSLENEKIVQRGFILFYQILHPGDYFVMALYTCVYICI